MASSRDSEDDRGAPAPGLGCVGRDDGDRVGLGGFRRWRKPEQRREMCGDGAGHMGELKAFLAVATRVRRSGVLGMAAAICDCRLCQILSESVPNLVHQRGLLSANDQKCQQKARK
jgi:hypothetical protein